jgi:hypothetical protein
MRGREMRLDTATLTGGRMPPLLARWKRAATVAAAILAASECGFQPRTFCQHGGRVRFRPLSAELIFELLSLEII